MSIKEYVVGLAGQMGVKLTGTVLIDGCDAGCTDACILDLISGGKLTGVLLYRSELEALGKGNVSSHLEIKVRKALGRLAVLSR